MITRLHTPRRSQGDEARTSKVYHNGRYTCPFDGKPKDGKKDSLLQHAIAISIQVRTCRLRAYHKELMNNFYLDDEGTSSKNSSKKK